MVGIIGDIHGCYNTLFELVKQIRQKYPNIELYSVGDLVDRGKFSYEVVDYVRKEKIKFTPGNHDYMFYYFMKKPVSALANSWLYNGYETTMQSYEDKYDKLGEHLDVIIEAPLYYDLNDCFISHAGISSAFEKKLSPKVLKDKEKLNEIILDNIDSEEGILWTRNKLLNLGKLQVVGHTRKPDILIEETSNVVYIDTSAYTGNKLSAIIVENSKIIEILSVPSNTEDLSFMYF
ncbi:MAG TPA: metallophosphoesterase family protein [Ignavibacteriaceae bacterium]|nr:metallophosphoesterase family protein [Ignavibacteriaceae bacterium]